MRILHFFILTMLFMSVIFQPVEAKRFGGGRSFGVQRSVSNFSRVQPAQAFRQRMAGNRWMAPLTGLLAGGLLGYLLMGHGIGTGILTWLILGGLLLFIISFIRNKLQFAAPSTHSPANFSQNMFSQNVHSDHAQTSASKPYFNTTGFDTEKFLRDAKVQFIRLQAAYDSKNLNDLREFTTPEVYAEIQLQLQERGNEANYTEVVSLDAEVINIEDELQPLVQVKFSGMIRESAHEAAKSFSEIWNFKKNAHSEWIVAGLQQI